MSTLPGSFDFSHPSINDAPDLTPAHLGFPDELSPRGWELLAQNVEASNADHLLCDGGCGDPTEGVTVRGHHIHICPSCFREFSEKYVPIQPMKFIEAFAY